MLLFFLSGTVLHTLFFYSHLMFIMILWERSGRYRHSQMGAWGHCGVSGSLGPWTWWVAERGCAARTGLVLTRSIPLAGARPDTRTTHKRPAQGHSQRLLAGQGTPCAAFLVMLLPQLRRQHEPARGRKMGGREIPNRKVSC